MNKIILITGASSGFGRLSAEALARAGHTVYASMRDTAGRNAPQVEQMATFSKHTASIAARSNLTFNRRNQQTTQWPGSLRKPVPSMS